MKILHVGQMIGGLDIYIRNSILYSKNDYEYVIVHGDKDKNKPVIKEGEKISEHLIRLYRKLNPFWDVVALVQTLLIICKEKPDLIHCHSAKGGFIGRIAGRITGTPTFYTPHAFSFLCTDSKLKRWIFLSLERIAKCNSYLLACSESERELAIKEVHYQREKALVWHNAVPDIKMRDNSYKEYKYICCIGRPSYQKNTLFLVDVIDGVKKRHPDVKFYLIGVGYYSPDLDITKKKLCEYHLEDTFEMLPWLSQQDTHQLIAGSMMYLTVARYEGLPLAVIEAMALSKAIVASDVVGNKDCVKDGENGFLLPLKVDAFVDKICYILENDVDRLMMSSKSRELFERYFLIDNRIKMLETIYESCYRKGARVYNNR